MPEYTIPKKNQQYITKITLVSQANTPDFQANPTLAAGDVIVSTDDGAFANIATLPTVTPAAGKGVKVTLSAGEMNGDIVLVIFHDAAGDEWDDIELTIHPSPNQMGDLATSTALATAQADLDNPSQYMANVSALATAAALAIAQADLDNPSQYMADVSALATAAALAIAQADLDNPDQYKADVSALATAVALAVVDGEVDTLITRLTAARAGYLDTLNTGVKVGELLAAALADMFDTDSGETYSSSVSGSVVKEIGSSGSSTASIVALILANAGAIVAAITESSISVPRGDTWDIPLSDLGDLTGYVTIDFTVKKSETDTDDEAIVRVRKNATGLNDGLMRIDGEAATAANGSITISDLTDGDIRIGVEAVETKDLAPDDKMYADVQVIIATDVETLRRYTFEIAADVTRLVA